MVKESEACCGQLLEVATALDRRVVAVAVRWQSNPLVTPEASTGT